MDRDLRQMEGMVEDMRRRNDPLTSHYERQTLIVKTRKEQLGDMYCGYAAAVSVRYCSYISGFMLSPGLPATASDQHVMPFPRIMLA